MAGCIGGLPLPEGRLDAGVLASGLEQTLDEAGIGEADIVGNSIGGYAAFELARRGRARRVVGIAPMGMFDRREAVQIERLLLRQHWFAHVPRPLVSAVMHSARLRALALRPLITNGASITPELAAHLVEAARSAAVPAFFAAARGDEGIVPAIHNAEEITTPALLLWGDRDPFASRAQMDRYLAALPDARLVELPGQSHSPQLQIPDRVAQEILNFIG